MKLAAASGQPTTLWASPAFVGAIAASFLAHAAALVMLVGVPKTPPPAPLPVPPPLRVTMVSPPPEVAEMPPPSPEAPLKKPSAAPSEPRPAQQVSTTVKTETSRAPASMEAPPAPSAEEWQQAATYTLKNSKRYRYAWGQQLRSMMGTAVEGPQQGDVRFRVEIAPDGRLTRLDTIWSTSDTAERLAREALSRMPPLPPTPNGKPLIFEKTISFQPHDTGWPPIYKYDCLPDPPGFSNPFVWNGAGDRPALVKKVLDPSDALTAAEQEECAKSLPKDSLEAVTVDQERQFKTWGSLPLNGVK